MRRRAAGIPPTVHFREQWRIALAQVRTVLQAGFTITGVVVDADDGANTAFRAGLERLGLAYGVAIRGEATFAVAGVPGPLTARFCALRVRPTAGRGERWLLCERAVTDERKYYLLHLAATTPLVELVELARSMRGASFLNTRAGRIPPGGMRSIAYLPPVVSSTEMGRQTSSRTSPAVSP